MSDYEDSSSSNESVLPAVLTSMFPPRTDRQAYLYLKDIWEHVNPPNREVDLQGKFFGVVWEWEDGKKTSFLVGQVKRRFLHDVDGSVLSLEIDCLKPALSTATELFEYPDHDKKDVYKFDIWDVVAGPLEAEFKSSRKWSIPTYPLAVQAYEKVLKLNRKEEYQRIYPDVQ